jgi:uncharacterized protein (DUF1015 family)
MRLHPFCALRPCVNEAQDVIAPPYDVLNTLEAKGLAEGRPWSFLHVTRPEIDLSSDVDIHDPKVYQVGAQNLERFRKEGKLVLDDSPAIWVYRLDMGPISQTGFVGCAEVVDYEQGRIKRHEYTRKAKEEDRTTHVDTLSAHTGPVFLTCRVTKQLAELRDSLTHSEPFFDVTAHDGVRHRLWRVGQADALQDLGSAFLAVEAFYIADGHHRAASACRVGRLRQERSAGGVGDASWQRFLVTVFPHDQVHIMPYNRFVKDLNGYSEVEFLEALEKDFQVGPLGAEPVPAARHCFGLFMGSGWRSLRARPAIIDEDDPVNRLDVAILQNHLLSSLLGIDDPRTNPRIEFVGGIRGTVELETRVRTHGTGLAISMYPTSMEELLSVADAGLVMPPKSTWFEPKLASGLLVHPIA